MNFFKPGECPWIFGPLSEEDVEQLPDDVKECVH